MSLSLEVNPQKHAFLSVVFLQQSLGIAIEHFLVSLINCRTNKKGGRYVTNVKKRKLRTEHF